MMIWKINSGESNKLLYVYSEISIFQEALERLAEGNNPQRTTSLQFANVSLPLVIKNEKEIDLTGFDYAGEQLTHIFESRSVNEKWRNFKNQCKWLDGIYSPE